MSTILLVQEDSALRAAWSMTLEAHGHSVLAAPAVADAIALAREGGIDAVVFDSIDPSRSARDLLDKLQRLPEPPPLILISASSKAPEWSARIGAAAFLPKPCTPDEIARVVRGVVNTHVRPHVLVATDYDETSRTKRDW